MSSRTGQIRKFKTPELCQIEIDETIRNNNDIVPSVFARVIGMKLRKIRLEKNLTQTKVSIMLDVTFQQIQKYECGMNAIGLRNLWKFCKLADTDINTFFEDLTKYDSKLEDHKVLGTGPDFNEDKIIRDGKED